jgi:predicted O-methyltransferase YrrM
VTNNSKFISQSRPARHEKSSVFTMLRDFFGRVFSSRRPGESDTATRFDHGEDEASAVEDDAAMHVPYDENLLERARTQWQFGDWESLARLERDTLQHHPDRSKLALLAAAAHLQLNNTAAGRQFVRLAQDWGCNKKLVSQILIAGVHNSLGRAAALAGEQTRALAHFDSAISTGIPGGDAKLLAHARVNHQLEQVGLPNWIAQFGGTNAIARATPSISNERSNGHRDASFQQQKNELEAQMTKQAEELVRVRKFLDQRLKNEVANSTKQIEAFLGVQNYLATGELPTLSTEKHSWPVSPDFALYLIELLETRDYDLIIEFGSGVSTVLISKTLAKTSVRRKDRPPAKLMSFEHLEEYHAQTLSSLKQAGLANTVHLELAPLESYLAANGNTYPYYACHEALARLRNAHSAAGLRILVVVDGPPKATGKHARYPAAPAVLSHFDDAHIDFLLDDFIRDDEKEIAQLWQDEFKAANRPFHISVRELEKDACLLTTDSTRRVKSL